MNKTTIETPHPKGQSVPERLLDITDLVASGEKDRVHKKDGLGMSHLN